MVRMLAMALVLGVSAATSAQTVRLPIGERKKLDTFFSNFSEAGLPAFRQSQPLTQQQLLEFAIGHESWNPSRRFDFARAKAVVRRYLDRELTLFRHENYPLQNGAMRVESQRGLDTEWRSTLLRLEKIAPNLYRAEVRDVMTSYGEGESRSYRLTQALMTKKGNRWVLLEYLPKGDYR